MILEHDGYAGGSNPLDVGSNPTRIPTMTEEDDYILFEGTRKNGMLTPEETKRDRLLKAMAKRREQNMNEETGG